MKKVVLMALVVTLLTGLLAGIPVTAASKTTISIVVMSGPYADAVRMVAPKFEREHNVSVKVIDMPYVGLHDKQLTELTARAGNFDVVYTLYQWLGEYAPYLEPLDTLAKKFKTNLADYPQQALKENGVWNGKLYVLPFPLETMMLFYRKDLIPNPPKTYDEAIAIAKKLTKPEEDFYGFAVMGAREQGETVFTDVLWGLGGKLLDENMKPVFNNAIGLEAMNKLLTLLKYSPPEAATYAIPEANADFLSGRVAMIEQWPSTITMQAEDPAQSKVVGKVGYAPVPGGHGHFGGMGFSVAKNSKNKDLAYQLIAYITAKENALPIMEKTGVYPSQTSILQDPQVNKKYPFMKPFEKALQGTIGRPKMPEATKLNDILDMRVSQVIAGEMSAKEALDAAAKEWEKILADAGYYKK